MKRVWQKHYEEGVATEIELARYNSLLDILEESCKEAGEKPAFANFGTELSFKELSGLSHAFAAYLVNKLDVKKGDRIAIMMPNLLQYPIALFGILLAGCVVVNINPLYTPSELSHILNDSEVKVIVILNNFAHTLESALPHVSIKHIILTSIGDLFPSPKKIIFNLGAKYVKQMVPEYELNHAIEFDTVLEEGKMLNFTQPGMYREDMAFLQYTGGTTGTSKGAILTHGNMVANVLQLIEWSRYAIGNKEQIMMTPLPLYHIFSLTGNLLFSVAIKSLSVLITNPKDIKHLINELINYKFTVITGVNTLFNVLLNSSKLKEVDFSRAKICITGGMAAQRSVAEKWKQVTGCSLIEGYGLTEASPLVCMNPLNITEYNGSIGLPVPSTDVEIRNENNQPVKFGAPGELCVSGPQVMKGYWNSPKENEVIFTSDGWLRTGDIARMDEEGFIYLVDRKKDMIIVSGFNVFPNEVEDAIMQNPGVLEVAVIGVPYEKTGEAVKAFIVRKKPDLTQEDILDTCRERLTHYKLPKFIEFRDELPKSNIGKILRKSLRE